jgi:hypothetical protein
MPQRSGARFIAETLKGYGVTHVFYMLAILRKTLVEMEDLGIQRILTHSEKSAAYMADGYARISGKPGVCMAQSVGAANLAAGLQDPYLAHSPVIALTGRKKPTAQYRNAYQEVIHAPLYESVTKFDANLDMVEQLPVLLAQAFREATAGAPRPVHLDLLGLSGEIIETAAIESAVNVDGLFSSAPAIRPEPEPGSVKQAAGLLQRRQRNHYRNPPLECRSGRILLVPVRESGRIGSRPGDLYRLQCKRSGHPGLDHPGSGNAHPPDRYRPLPTGQKLRQHPGDHGRRQGLPCKTVVMP